MTYRDEWKRSIDGHPLLRQIHEQLRDEIASRWNRSLPFGEELFDRWERAEHLGFGEGTSIYDSSVVLGDVTVGDNTWIGPFTVLDGSGGLFIGANCSVSAGVQIYSHDTVAWALTGGLTGPERSAVRIGDCTYLGPNAVVSRGVTIGDRCVIGAGTLVNGDVPGGSIVFGTPGRIVGHVEVAEGSVRFSYEADHLTTALSRTDVKPQP